MEVRSTLAQNLNELDALSTREIGAPLAVDEGQAALSPAESQDTGTTTQSGGNQC